VSWGIALVAETCRKVHVKRVARQIWEGVLTQFLSMASLWLGEPRDINLFVPALSRKPRPKRYGEIVLGRDGVREEGERGPHAAWERSRVPAPGG